MKSKMARETPRNERMESGAHMMPNGKMMADRAMKRPAKDRSGARKPSRGYGR